MWTRIITPNVIGGSNSFLAGVHFIGNEMTEIHLQPVIVSS